MNFIYGYARVSTEEQNLATQLEALEAAGCHRIFQDKISGTTTSRPDLDNMLKYLRPGDTVIVSRFFRLGRNSRHLLELLEQFNRDGVIFKALDLGVDGNTPAGKLMLSIFAALAEFQREELLEKTRHGRRLAKAAGTHMGRRAGVKQEQLAKVRTLLDNGLTVPVIVEATGISKSSVQRYRRIIEAEKALKASQATQKGTSLQSI